jgi:hypothetical protein
MLVAASPAAATDVVFIKSLRDVLLMVSPRVLKYHPQAVIRDYETISAGRRDSK